MQRIGGGSRCFGLRRPMPMCARHTYHASLATLKPASPVLASTLFTYGPS